MCKLQTGVTEGSSLCVLQTGVIKGSSLCICYRLALLKGPDCPDLNYLVSVVDLLATCAEVS